MYGEGAHQNLASLAKASDDFSELVTTQVLNPVRRHHIHRAPLGVVLKGAVSMASNSTLWCVPPSSRFISSHSSSDETSHTNLL